MKVFASNWDHPFNKAPITRNGRTLDGVGGGFVAGLSLPTAQEGAGDTDETRLLNEYARSCGDSRRKVIANR